MARQKLTGIYIPVVTPFNEDESINFAAIDEVAKFLAENGVDGIIPSGSTGEMIAMTKEEQMAVNKAYIQAGHKYGIKVVASTGAYRTGDVIEMSKAAEADGADGVMVVTPWYMGPNKEELYHHYKAIHDSIDISLMMYHNPYYSTVLLDDRFIAKMYNEGCIDAIKERQADVFRQQNLRRLTDDNFAIFYGYDVCPVETQSTWSDGWVVGTGNLFPKENSTIYKLAKAGKLKEAMKAQEELDAREYEGTAGGGAVSCKVSGKRQLLSLTIDKDAVDPEEVEMLQDMIVAAVNDALKKGEETRESEMSKIGGAGMGGMF